MAKTDIQTLVIAGAISQLPPEEREYVEACAEKLRAVVKEYEAAGLLALALVGAELSE